MAEFDVRGMDAVVRRLGQLARAVPEQVGKALYEEMQTEATESRRRTPVDTGALRASHHVSRPSFRGRNIEVKVTVGGVAAPYAVLVHEDLDAYHRTGQAKFLESTLMESRPYMAQRIAARLKLRGWW